MININFLWVISHALDKQYTLYPDCWFKSRSLIIYNMDAEDTQKPTLIYFKTRGYAQIIRCVLLEIGVDFN